MLRVLTSSTRSGLYPYTQKIRPDTNTTRNFRVRQGKSGGIRSGPCGFKGGGRETLPPNPPQNRAPTVSPKGKTAAQPHPPSAKTIKNVDPWIISFVKRHPRVPHGRRTPCLRLGMVLRALQSHCQTARLEAYARGQKTSQPGDSQASIQLLPSRLPHLFRVMCLLGPREYLLDHFMDESFHTLRRQSFNDSSSGPIVLPASLAAPFS